MFQFVATFEIRKTLTSKLGITTFKYKTVVLCKRLFHRMISTITWLWVCLNNQYSWLLCDIVIGLN